MITCIECNAEINHGRFVNDKEGGFRILCEQCYHTKPRKVKLIEYRNIYPWEHRYSYASREEADKSATRERISCVRIEFEYEEGQFDD